MTQTHIYGLCQRGQRPGGLGTKRIKTGQFKCDIAILGGHAIRVCICNRPRFAPPAIRLNANKSHRLLVIATRLFPRKRYQRMDMKPALLCSSRADTSRMNQNHCQSLSCFGIRPWTKPRPCNNRALLLFG